MEHMERIKECARQASCAFIFLEAKLFYTKNVKITKGFVEHDVTISLLISNW